VTKGSPTSIIIAYVRRALPAADDAPTQVWQLSLPSLEAHLLVEGKGGDTQSPKLVPEQGSPLLFSPDGRYLYYNSEGWATSSAIVELDLEHKSARVVTDGNGVYVIRNGRLAGALVTSKHRYYPQGGSYDWDYVVDRTGKELLNSGRETDRDAFVESVEGRP
jgi:hypothetical protein